MTQRARRTLDPATLRLGRRPRKGPYKVVAIGLYEDQADALDLAAEVLQRAGLNQASRSFLVQSLVRRLKAEMEGLGPEEMAGLLLERYVRRPLAPAPSRASVVPPKESVQHQRRLQRRSAPQSVRVRSTGSRSA